MWFGARKNQLELVYVIIAIFGVNYYYMMLYEHVGSNYEDLDHLINHD